MPSLAPASDDVPAPSVLLVANRTCPCPDVSETVGGLAGPKGRVHVVVPALDSRLRHLVSDTDAATRDAGERLGLALDYVAHAAAATSP